MNQYQTRASQWFRQLRDTICDSLEEIEEEACRQGHTSNSGKFERECWTREQADGSPGGGGEMSMLRGGLIEKGGVHISTVHGRFSVEMQKIIKGAERDPSFWASGISLILHPFNPQIPTVHMNTRMICTQESWFGGGADLTPMVNAQRTQDHPQTVRFHDAMKQACQPHKSSEYDHYKSWCDEYFFLHHRKEPRGIGGIFFDHLNSQGWEEDFAFVKQVGLSMLGAYQDILRSGMGLSFSDKDVDEQLHRRGRYVEFNLLHDRGTLFGLKTGGNIDAILSSLPPRVSF